MANKKTNNSKPRHKRLTVWKDGRYLYFNRHIRRGVVRYDLAERQMEKQLPDATFRPVSHQYKYFKHIGVSDIVFPETKFKTLIRLARKSRNYGKTSRCKNFSTFLSELARIQHYEPYLQRGFRVEKPGLSQEITEPITSYDENTLRILKKYDVKINKNLEQRYNEDPDRFQSWMTQIDQADLYDDEKNDIINKIKRNNSIAYALLTEYNYKCKALVEYVYNYLPFEAYNDAGSGLRTLRDYYSMAETLGRDVDKYPKYLQSTHDIIQKNYEQSKKEFKDEIFKDRIDEDKEWTGEEYTVINPETPDDVVREGTMLSHCVSSYVERIIDGKTYICFLRRKENPDVPLVTLTVNNETISHARGKRNRKIKPEEEQALRNYARDKGFDIELRSL